MASQQECSGRSPPHPRSLGGNDSRRVQLWRPGCHAGKCPPGAGHPFFKVVEVFKILASILVGADHKCWSSLNHFLSVPKSPGCMGWRHLENFAFSQLFGPGCEEEGPPAPGSCPQRSAVQSSHFFYPLVTAPAGPIGTPAS